MRARLTIDLEAIAANWRALDALSGPDVETGAVVKANAYGLGIDRVAPVLWKAGARSFFVALTEEGAALRAVLPQAHIYVFSGLMPGDAVLCRDAGLIPLLNSLEQIAGFNAALPQAPFGLQIDSGMNRLGLEPGDLPAARDLLDQRLPQLVISHLACSDTPQHPQNARQLTAFDAAAAQFGGVRQSLSATGGILLDAAYHKALTRPGIGLYGGLPFKGATPVVTLDLPVIQTRDVAKGEAVGYGADFVAQGPRRIATVAAGYADGILRAAGQNPALHADGIAVPLAGRISMDLITADVTDLATPPETLQLLGAHQGIDQLARAAGTIGYEILTSLGARYDRVYKGG